MFENEEWMLIDDLPMYAVSNYGRVRHESRNDVRKPSPNKNGFPVVVLYSEGGTARYLRQVNTLVAKAFLPDPGLSEMNSVWHIDGDLLNCRADNLQWETRRKVLEWNEMHRSREPKYKTPRVKHVPEGAVYSNAFDCAMDLGVLESYIVWKIERQAWDMFSEDNDFRYVTESSPA